MPNQKRSTGSTARKSAKATASASPSRSSGARRTGKTRQATASRQARAKATSSRPRKKNQESVLKKVIKKGIEEIAKIGS